LYLNYSFYFLFSKNNVRRTGDIVVIDVFKKLKKEISLELARAFPKRKRRKKKKSDKAATPPASDQAGDKKESSSKVYDRISSVIVE